MTATLPKFIYPAESTVQPDGYTFNYIGSVNVSWYWDQAPEGSSVGLILWSQSAGSSNYSPSTFFPRATFHLPP